ncbi:unnamed protein product [Durusdinium trenchii]|uniref:Uncharacterized protein n=4 Tax=Durusdinium trenchii TaxID=1381693 RepID=A0ABP0JU66_9DINO
MAALEESRTCANMEALLDSLLQSEPDLGDPLGYRLAWGKLKVDQYPIMTTKQVDAFRRDGAVLLSFGESRIIQDDTLRVTPSTRQTGNVGLNTVADYMLLAVAKQVVQLMPAVVCDVQSFEELYDGRLITDILPEAKHTTYDGSIRERDHTRVKEDAMRLHVDDCDHLLRAPVQLLLGIKNVKGTATTVALTPPDADLHKEGIDPEILRSNSYKHKPPNILSVDEDDIPLRPVLYGTSDAPQIQADWKSTSAISDQALEANLHLAQVTSLSWTITEHFTAVAPLSLCAAWSIAVGSSDFGSLARTRKRNCNIAKLRKNNLVCFAAARLIGAGKVGVTLALQPKSDGLQPLLERGK